MTSAVGTPCQKRESPCRCHTRGRASSSFRDAGRHVSARKAAFGGSLDGMCLALRTSAGVDSASKEAPDATTESGSPASAVPFPEGALPSPTAGRHRSDRSRRGHRTRRMCGRATAVRAGSRDRVPPSLLTAGVGCATFQRGDQHETTPGSVPDDGNDLLPRPTAAPERMVRHAGRASASREAGGMLRRARSEATSPTPAASSPLARVRVRERDHGIAQRPHGHI